MVRVLGLGLGLFLLTFLWTICIIACIVLTRKQGMNGAFAPMIAGLLITILLVFFPREKTLDLKPSYEVIDHVFIPRMLLLTVLTVFLLISFVLFVLSYLSQPVFASAPVQLRR